MPPEPREWSVPAPVRALLWWPPVAFLLVMVAPGTADAGIALSGLVLALCGALGGAVRQRSARARAAGRHDDAPVPLPVPMERRAA